jgi:hypothetical protein
MNDQEPIPDLILLLQPQSAVLCVGCQKPVIGEPFWIPSKYKTGDQPYHPACEDCYGNYIKKKFGSGNTNPDEIAIV